MNVPVPPIFLYETDLSRYEVMDGQQRLISIIDFYENKFELKRLTAWSALNGFRFNDLPDRLKRGLDRRRISAVILLAESAAPEEVLFADIRREVFERLNTGGTALNAQELRNSIFGGPFNDLLVHLAKGHLFCEMWGIPPHANALSEELQNNELFKQMADCQIVLRFFAFREKEHVSGSVKNMLDSCMKRNQLADKDKIKYFQDLFNTRLAFVNETIGKDAFRLPESLNGRLSRPLFDALMIASDRLWPSANNLKKKKTQVRTALKTLIEKPKNYAVIVGRANTAKAVLGRIALVEKALKSVL